MIALAIDPSNRIWKFEGHRGLLENAVVHCSCGAQASLIWTGEKAECVNPRWRFNTRLGWGCGKRSHHQVTTQPQARQLV